jgi:hypothetical protein
MGVHIPTRLEADFIVEGEKADRLNELTLGSKLNSMVDGLGPLIAEERRACSLLTRFGCFRRVPAARLLASRNAVFGQDGRLEPGA